MKFIVTMAVLLIAIIVEASIFNVEAVISRMNEHQNIKCGKSPKCGIWIVARTIVEPSAKLTDGEANELGLALAKKEIAAFFGTSVKSVEEAGSSIKTTVRDGIEKSEYEEFSREATRIEVDQFLRGVVIYKTIKGDNGERIVYSLATSSIIDAAKEMKNAMEKLPPDTVAAVGISAMPDETIETQRQAALASAKRFAIEQVLGSSVSATTQVQDGEKVRAKIYASANGFVEEMRIISEGEFAGGYKVQIIAKVARDKLMSNYTSVMKSMGDPGFLVATNQKDLYMGLTDFFSSLGIRVVGTEAEADYIIDARGDFREVRDPTQESLLGTQLSLWVRIYNATTKQELFAIKNEPRKATVFHSTGDRQIEIAAEKAYKQLKEPLHKKLNEMLGKMAATGREVIVKVENYSDSYDAEFKLLVKALEGTPGCANVVVGKIDSITGVAIVRINYTAASESLADFITNRLEKDIEYRTRRPKLQSAESSMVTFSF